jgi:hypothetical protein
MKRPSEAECTTTIINTAIQAGWFVHHMRPSLRQSGSWSSAIQGTPGWPDLVLAHAKRRQCIVVELKRRPNRVEPKQQEWIDTLEACGITAEVWWVPEELDSILSFLTARPVTSLSEVEARRRHPAGGTA